MFSIAILYTACAKVDKLIVNTDEPTIVEDTTALNNLLEEDTMALGNLREEERATLSNLLAGIKEMAESEKCENADDWKFTPVGGICCGPEVYIAYSKKIDEKLFLDKVEAYNIARKDFNIKWDILSVCDLIDCAPELIPESISCKNGKAVFNYEKSNTTKQEDFAALKALGYEIKAMAESVACENADEWKFTPIGTTACGAYDYMAYSEKIDEEVFLQKIETFTNTQNEFNIKWGMGFNCIAVPVPQSVSCANGKPVFSYYDSDANTSIEHDTAALEELLIEIKEIAESVTCENVDEWKFTKIGKLGDCWKPAGYIAYSLKIDEVEFLKKVSTYTKAQDAFNIKWGIVSPCDFSESDPKSIRCVDGKAVLKYTHDTTIEHDRAVLDTLLTEIKDIAESVTCENADEWKFTRIGSKACGGPTGYIAYSDKIDEAKFLEKVQAYTIAEADFNRKWGIISDCAIEPEPKSLSCVDGKAVLNY